VQLVSAEEIHALAPPAALIEALRAAFRAPPQVPSRQVLRLPHSAGERSFLSMPAFGADGAAVVKLVTVVPDNPARQLPAVQGVLVVFDRDGTPAALLDGTAITRARTAAASALASSYLSRADSSHLVVIGTGALAPYMVAAHAAVRPIRRVSVCGRNPGAGASTVAAVRAQLPGVTVAVSDAGSAVAAADIVCCATSSPTPVLMGAWLRPGTLVDLVGGYLPQERESDDEVVRRSRIFVDTFDGALREAGDILEPLARGVLTRERIEGELSDLVCGRVRGRERADEIIVFKSVGTAIEDFAAAQLVLATLRRPPPT